MRKRRGNKEMTLFKVINNINNDKDDDKSYEEISVVF